MEDMSLLVAQNLKKLREKQKLSLDKLAELSGVSKSMLSQIERGDSSPTITTVWKIAKGLNVSFTSLVEAPHSDTVLIRQAEVRPLIENDGKYRLFPFFSVEEGRRFEVYSIEMDTGGNLSAEAHSDGTQEFITVFSGELTLGVGQQEYRVGPGDSIRFHADQPHVYQNLGEGLVKLSLVIHYG